MFASSSVTRQGKFFDCWSRVDVHVVVVGIAGVCLGITVAVVGIVGVHVVVVGIIGVHDVVSIVVVHVVVVGMLMFTLL